MDHPISIRRARYAPVNPLARRYGNAVALTTAELAPSIAVIGVFFVAGRGMQTLFGIRDLMSVGWYTPLLIDFCFAALLLAAGALLAHRWQSLRTDAVARALPAIPGWRLAASECMRRTLTPERVVRVAAVCIVTPLLLATYGSWKLAIPQLMPFASDEPIARVIEPLFGGVLPWQWLQPVLGHPLVTLAIDRVYATLFIAIFAVVLWQAWHDDATARSRFFLSFTLTWFVLGVVAATLGSSAGPCFYAGVAPGPDPYRPLLDYLARVDQQHPLIAVQMQRLLWNAYVHQIPTTLTGISAFPSLHVAVAVLFMLAAFQQSRWLGTAFSMYALVIWIGSIHLGWHYAVDGYAAALGVTIIWIAVGRMVRAHPKGPTADPAWLSHHEAVSAPSNAAWQAHARSNSSDS